MEIPDARLGSAAPGTHLLQFYSDDLSQLARNVSKYFIDGFDAGCTAMLVATKEHQRAILDDLKDREYSPEALQREGLLHVFDAEQTLQRIIVGGWPDPERFESIAVNAVRDAASRMPGAGVCAFGEMVGLLWERKQYPAAIRLEQMWNNFQTRERISLYCAYPVDLLGCDFEAGIVDPLLCAHTQVVPNDRASRMHTAIDQAMREVLDCAERRLMTQSRGRKAWATLPPAEAAILWLHKYAPERADDVIARARRYYEAVS